MYRLATWQGDKNVRLTPQPGTTSRPFWLLALIIGSGSLGMHIFAPILPLIGQEFSIGIAETQQTISVYMFAFATGQLIYGPLSDRYGRRPVLLFGLVVFTLAGLLCTVVTSMEWLLVARMAQALGGCAGLVLGRAIVHDTTHGADAASTIGALNTLLLVSPAVAPVLGLWISEHTGWRAVPLILVGFGATAFIGTLLLISETAERKVEPVAATFLKYGRLLSSPPFMVQLFASALTTTTMFVVLSMSPFIVTGHLALPLKAAGSFYLVFIGGLVVGSVVASRLVRRFGFDNLILLAALAGTIGSLLHVGTYLSGRLDQTAFLVSGFLYTFMSGTTAPLALTRTIGLAPDMRGSATGLFGFAQIFAGAMAVSIASAGADVVLSTGIVMLGCSGLGLSIVFCLRLAAARK